MKQMYICLYENTNVSNIKKVYYFNEFKYATNEELRIGITVDSIPENNLISEPNQAPTLFLDIDSGQLYWELTDIEVILTPEQRIQELENELLLLADQSEGGIL